MRPKRDADTWLAKQQEKLIKMTNPNYKISTTRLLLKCIDKNITSERLRSWIYNTFEGVLPAKKLRTLKLLKDIKIVSEAGQQRGFAFVDFSSAERALQFAKLSVEHKDDTMSELGNTRGETPIIEFAFEDVKKLQRIEDTKNKQRQENATKETEEEELPADKKTKLEKKRFQRALQSNRKLMAKKLVSDALTNGSEDIARTALESVNGLRSRGIKHRLLVKLSKQFSHIVPTVEKDNEQKPDKSEEIEQPERRKKIEKAKKPAQNDETLIKIKHDVKTKNKQLRRAKNASVDKPDEFEASFARKVQKKGKWSETA